MWDLKLYFIDTFFFFSLWFADLTFVLINTIDPYLFNGLAFFNWKILFQFSQNLTFIFALKFLISIGFLILIRGGTPRYRYDYLTKLGWLKFLGFIVTVFLFSLFIFFNF